MQNVMNGKCNATTCTCNITSNAPPCTSTPNTSPRIVDCCLTPDISILDNKSSQSPTIIIHDTFDIDDAVILQCSESCSSESIKSNPPNITTSVRKFVQDRLNKTYAWAFPKKVSNSLDNTCELKASHSCPKLMVDCANKSCAFRLITKDCCQPIKHCDARHVEFATQRRESCRHAGIENKFCQQCKEIYDYTPCLSTNSCKHVKIADQLCDKCKRLLNPRDIKSCTTIDRIYEKCRNLLTSVSSQTTEQCVHVGIDDIIFKHCNNIINNAPSHVAETCKHDEVFENLCKKCQNVITYASYKRSGKITQDSLSCYSGFCRPCHSEDESCRTSFYSKPCEHVDKTCNEQSYSNKQCKQSDESYNSDPCCSKTLKQEDKSTTLEPCCCSEPSSNTDACIYVDNSSSTDPCYFSNKGQHVEHFSNTISGRFLLKLVDKAVDTCVFKKKYFDPAPFQSIKIRKLVDKSRDPCFNQDPTNNACESVEKLCDTHLSQSYPAPTQCQTAKLSKIVDKAHSPGPLAIKTVDQTYDSSKSIKAASQPVKSCKCFDKSCKTTPNKTLKLCEIIERANKFESSESIRLNKYVDMACDPCIASSTPHQEVKSYKNIHVQVPEKGEGYKSFEMMLTDDEGGTPVGFSTPESYKSGECACTLGLQSTATLTNLNTLDPKLAAENSPFLFGNESMCRSSGAESPPDGGSCASARAHYYHNKLLATLQILQNKEETVRVQAESLAVAESRIAALTTRHADLKREMERKEREIQSLRKAAKEYRPCKVEKFDASITAEVAEMDDHDNIVSTLQNNLGVIEDLYRECFYETVKQEHLIEMLRNSNLDIRLMNKEKSDRISKLHNVINTQKWSLDRCQDIATEVENLKIEISNFVNSSNNDSGVWEESVVSDLNDDLQDIAAQLLRLKDMLIVDCTCGLEEENRRLRQNNENMEVEISNLRSRICDLETNLHNKSSSLEKLHQQEMVHKERELCRVQEQLQSAMQNVQDKSSRVDMLTLQIAQTKETLEEKTTELCCLQKQCKIYDDTIKVMKEELNKSEQITKENMSLHNELCVVSRRAARLERRATTLEAELCRARTHCEAIELAYRDKTSSSLELEREVESAHARGAELCAEAARAARAVRGWAHRMLDKHREQEKQIQGKEYDLQRLQRIVEENKEASLSAHREWDQTERSFSPRPSTSADSNVGASCSKCVRILEGSSPPERERENDAGVSSASEMPSCSSPSPPPRAPKRTCLKRPGFTTSTCGIRRRFGWLGPFSAVQRDATAQHPTRCDATTRHSDPSSVCLQRHADATLCALSPGEEMFSRVENLSAALADGYRRWSRRNT